VAQLSVEEARSLSRVFGEIDRQKSVLLLLFHKPNSRWGIMPMIKKLPKTYRVPTASLYRKVNELYDSSFLKLLNTERGRAGIAVSYYGLSLKGYLAACIYAYVLFLDAKTSASVKEQTGLDKLVKNLESTPGWSLFIDFLRWHKDRNIDLSNVKIDIAYFSLTLTLSMLDHPENVTEQDLIRLSEHLKQFGLVPQKEPKEILQLLQSTKKSIQEVGENVLALLRRPNGQPFKSSTSEESKS